MKNKKTYFIILLFISSFIATSCGIKGPPLPPINEETIQKQKAAEILIKQQEETAKAASVAASNDATKAKNKKKK